MRSPYTITLLVLGSQLVSASSADTTCGTCVAGYVCKAGACVLDTAHLTGNPLPILTQTSDNPGGPIKTTGMSDTTETATATTGEAKTTSAATGGATTSTGEAKTTSGGGGHSSSSSPSMTSQVVSTSAPASSSSAAAAATSSGVAGSLAVDWDSWVAWGIAWAVGLPLVV